MLRVFFLRTIIEGEKKMKNKKPILVLIVAAFAAFLATFNETFLNIAFTPIMKDFGVSVSTVQWLTTAYMLGAAIMVPVSAFMYRKFKTKPLFLFTVSLLIIGSLICALASNFEILLTGRIIQSLGTGMLVPIAMNLTLNVVPREKMGTYMGIMGAATTLGPSLSIISAGAILNFSTWQTLFWIFCALTLILFILALIILGKTKKNENPKLDVFSVILISLALIGILYGVSTLFSGNIIIALIAIIIGAIALILFVKRQNKISEPLVGLKPLSIKPFRSGIILNMLALMIVFSMNIIMPLYIQSALSVSAFTASITLFPAIILSCIIAPIAGKIYDKKGIKHILPLGFILIFVFILLLGLTRDMHSLIAITLLYIPVICGSSLIIGPVQSFALGSLNKEDNPNGVTMVSTGFQIAGCVGSSIFTGVYSLMLGLKLGEGASQSESLSFAYFITLLVAVAIAFIGFIIAMHARKYEKALKQEIPRHLTLESIMKKDVFTVNENTTLIDVLKFITAKKVSGVPIINNKNQLVGFISDGDIMRYLAKSHPLFTNVYSFTIASKNDFDEKLNDLMKLKVKDIVKKKTFTVDINTSLEDVCKFLTDNHLKKSPVIKDGKMVGIINRSNITKYAIDCYLGMTK